LLCLLFCRFVYPGLAGEKKGHQLRDTYGGWAIVTGASSGIGAEFARLIAADGMNVVLVARRKDLLEKLSEALEKEYNVQTRVIAIDLGTKQGPYQLHEATKTLDVGLLVNNAGFGWFGDYSNQDVANIEMMIQLNVTSLTILSRLFYDNFALRDGRSGILNNSSIGGYFTGPVTALYVATKSYVNSLTIALWQEERKKAEPKVDILCLEPGSTATEFGDVSGVKGVRTSKQVTPRFVAEKALDALLGQRHSLIPSHLDYFQSFISYLPRSFLLPITYRIFSKLRGPQL